MKRALAFLLSLLFILPISVFAAEDAVYVHSAEELASLSARVAAGDSMKGVTVYLEADIALSDVFTPIGTDPAHPFSGVFDGKGHSIKGLKINGGEYSALFGCVTDGEVKSLKIENADIKGGDFSAILVGRLYGYSKTARIENCYVSGSVNGGCYVGALCGSAYAFSSGDTSRVYIESSSARAAVFGDMYVGGICGKAESIATDGSARLYIDGCTVEGNGVSQGDYGAIGGGVCGGLSAYDKGGSVTATVKNCISYVNVQVEKTAAGGICGAVGAINGRAYTSVEDCVAVGSTYAGALSAGLCGKVEAEGDGVALTKGCVAAGSVGGGSVYSLTSGIGAEECIRAYSSLQLPAGVTVPATEKGDVNGDGETDSLDAAFILKYDVGLAIAGVSALVAADINGDGAADSLDAAQVLRYDVFGRYDN